MGDPALTRLSLRDEAALLESVAELAAGGVLLPDAYAAAGELLRGASAGAATAIGTALRRGEPVAVAAAGTLARLDPVHHAMLRAIDTTGDPARCLEQARLSLQAKVRLREQLSAGAAYPIAVVAITLAAAVVVVAVVIPGAANLFPSDSPAVETLMRRGRHLLFAMLGCPGGAFLAFAGLRIGARSERGRGVIDRMRLRVPVIGEIERSRELLAYFQVLGGLLAVGEPLARAVRGASGAACNREIGTRLRAVASEAERGTPLSSAFARRLPELPIVSRWFAIAEAGGTSRGTADALARVLESRVSRLVGLLGALAEPALLALAGAVVIVVVVSVVVPLFDLPALVLP